MEVKKRKEGVRRGDFVTTRLSTRRNIGSEKGRGLENSHNSRTSG